MFHFGTSDGQVVYLSRTNIGTSNGQALVPKNKHIQTNENNKNLNKQKNLKDDFFQNKETGSELKRSVPYEDNLKVSGDKNYNDPL